jgi:hypothetical protein
MERTLEAGKRLNITATNAALKGGGSLIGIWVSSASAVPTIKVEDSAGVIANTFTPVGPNFYRLPVVWTGTLTVTISGTVDCTIVYDK